MPTCPARKANGEICGIFGRFYQGHCGTHHNSKLARDPAYRAEYETYQANVNQRREEELAAVAQRTAERERARIARRAAEQAEEERARTERRRIQLDKNAKAVADAPLYSPAKIMIVANKIASLWHDNAIPEYHVMHAYAVLKYVTSTHVGFSDVICAAVKLICLGSGHHPDYASYVSVPEEERAHVLAEIQTALQPYGEFNVAIIPSTDKCLPFITERRRREEEAIRAEEERRRREQLAIDLRERPVVFERDPEGSINLAAFARDSQSVHRSSVQNTTHKMVLAILQRPLIDGQETLFEILNDFNNVRIIRWSNGAIHEKVVTEVTNDYYNTEAFSLPYGDVLNHVWAYIRPHAQHNDLVVRLAQELIDGLGMCSNGKMARLMNVLQGYDETLEQEAPKELFQNKIALLTALPLEEREAAARALFAEFRIASEEQQVWLEPLLEA